MATDAEGREILPEPFTEDDLRRLYWRVRELARHCQTGQEEEHLLELQIAVMRYLRWQVGEAKTAK